MKKSFFLLTFTLFISIELISCKKDPNISANSESINNTTIQGTWYGQKINKKYYTNDSLTLEKEEVFYSNYDDRWVFQQDSILKIHIIYDTKGKFIENESDDGTFSFFSKSEILFHFKRLTPFSGIYDFDGDIFKIKGTYYIPYNQKNEKVVYTYFLKRQKN